MADNTTLNSQIADALEQINATLGGLDRGLITAAAYQTIAQAIALGLQNAVAQQQQAYILRNALTTAAATAILEGKKDEADAVLRLAESRMISPSFSTEIADLLAALRTVAEELRKLHREPPPEPPPPSPAATPEPEPAGDKPA